MRLDIPCAGADVRIVAAFRAVFNGLYGAAALGWQACPPLSSVFDRSSCGRANTPWARNVPRLSSSVSAGRAWRSGSIRGHPRGGRGQTLSPGARGWSIWWKARSSLRGKDRCQPPRGPGKRSMSRPGSFMMRRIPARRRWRRRWRSPSTTTASWWHPQCGSGQRTEGGSPPEHSPWGGAPWPDGPGTGDVAAHTHALLWAVAGQSFPGGAHRACGHRTT
jgi:hypothetical protein